MASKRPEPNHTTRPLSEVRDELLAVARGEQAAPSPTLSIGPPGQVTKMTIERAGGGIVRLRSVTDGGEAYAFTAADLRTLLVLAEVPAHTRAAGDPRAPGVMAVLRDWEGSQIEPRTAAEVLAAADAADPMRQAKQAPGTV